MKASLLKTRILTLPPHAVTFPAFRPAAPIPAPPPPVPEPEPPVVLPVAQEWFRPPFGERGSHRKSKRGPLFVYVAASLGLAMVAAAGGFFAALTVVR